MQKQTVSMIAAIGATNRVLGKDNHLPWDLPEDQKYFRRVTKGHPVIMGRKTYESIPEAHRPLPERVNIVITRDSSYEAPDCIVVGSINEALERARETGSEEIFVIGGARVYAEALPLTDRLYLTLVEGDFEGDTFFPPYPEFTKEIFRERHDGEIPFTFITLERSTS